jgi:hypothetical protein
MGIEPPLLEHASRDIHWNKRDENKFIPTVLSGRLMMHSRRLHASARRCWLHAPSSKKHLAALCPVHAMYLGDDLEIELCVFNVYHDFTSVLVDLLQSAAQGLCQRDKRPNDACHPHVWKKNMLAKMSQDAVSANP